MSFWRGTHDLRRGGVVVPCVAPPIPPCVPAPVPATTAGTVGDGGVDCEVDGDGRREENDVRLSEDFEARAFAAKLIEGTGGIGEESSESWVMSAVLLLRACFNFLKSAIGDRVGCGWLC